MMIYHQVSCFFTHGVDVVVRCAWSVRAVACWCANALKGASWRGDGGEEGRGVRGWAPATLTTPCSCNCQTQEVWRTPLLAIMSMTFEKITKMSIALFPADKRCISLSILHNMAPPHFGFRNCQPSCNAIFTTRNLTRKRRGQKGAIVYSLLQSQCKRTTLLFFPCYESITLSSHLVYHPVFRSDIWH